MKLQELRDKYPQYNPVPDDLLRAKVEAKYPGLLTDGPASGGYQTPQQQLQQVQLEQAKFNLEQDKKKATTSGGQVLTPPTPFTQSSPTPIPVDTQKRPPLSSALVDVPDQTSAPATQPTGDNRNILQKAGDFLSPKIKQNVIDPVTRNYSMLSDYINYQLASPEEKKKIGMEYGKKFADQEKWAAKVGFGTAESPGFKPGNFAKEAGQTALEAGSWIAPVGEGIKGMTAMGGLTGAMRGASTVEKPTDILPNIAGGAAGGAIGGAVIGGISAAASKLLKDVPKNIMNNVFKETPREARSAIKKGEDTLGEQVLNKGSVGSPETFLQTALDRSAEAENTIQSALLGSKGKVKMSDIKKSLDPLINEYKQAGNVNAVNDIITRLKNIQSESGSVIPAVRANEIKRTLYDEVRKAYGVQGSAGVESTKNIARAFKEAIGNLDIPNVSQANKDLSYYGRIADVMTDTIRKNTGKGVDLADLGLTAFGGVPGVATAIGKHVLSSPTAKVAIAQGMNKTGQGLEKVLPAVLPPIGKAGQIAGSSLLSGQPQSVQQGIQQDPNAQNSETNATQDHILPSITQSKKNPLEGYMVDGKPISPSDANIIKNIADYKLDISKITSLRTDERTRIAGLVSQFDPSWDMTQYNARNALRKDFTSGKSSQGIRSLNTAIGHLASLQKTGEELGNTGLPAINTAKNAAMTAMGQPQTTKFNNALNAVAGEMAMVFKGTSGTDAEIKSWKEQMSSSQSPAQIKAGIDQMIELIGSRLYAYDSQWNSGMNKPRDFALLNKKSRKILSDLGVDTNALDPVSE